MMPDELAPAFIRVHAAITASRAAAVLEPLRPFATRPKPDVQALLHVFAALASGHTQFSEAEQSVFAAFGLQAVTDTAWWADLITACTRSTMNQEAASMIEGIHARLQIAGETFPALAGLLSSAATMRPALQPPTQAAGIGGIALLLPGLDGAPPVLARVASAIEGLNQLWTVAEDLTGQRGALRLAGVEPEPVMALYFDGLAEPLEELRSLLLSIWEQAARLPRTPAEQLPALVPEMLPVMQRIGQISRADALRVRSAIEGGVRRLLEAGCVLPASPEASVREQDAVQDLTAAGAGWGRLPATSGLAVDNGNDLAAVIAEERRQLKQAEPARRLWHGTATTAASA